MAKYYVMVLKTEKDLLWLNVALRSSLCLGKMNLQRNANITQFKGQQSVNELDKCSSAKVSCYGTTFLSEHEGNSSSGQRRNINECIPT